MKTAIIADITLATILALLLIANVVVMVKIKTYKSLSTGLVSLCLICLILAREIQLGEKIWQVINDQPLDAFDDALRDVDLYLFTLISIALLIQWLWTY